MESRDPKNSVLVDFQRSEILKQGASFCKRHRLIGNGSICILPKSCGRFINLRRCFDWTDLYIWVVYNSTTIQLICYAYVFLGM